MNTWNYSVQGHRRPLMICQHCHHILNHMMSLDHNVYTKVQKILSVWRPPSLQVEILISKIWQLSDLYYWNSHPSYFRIWITILKITFYLIIKQLDYLERNNILFETGQIQWAFSQYCRYWYPGALAPGHQHIAEYMPIHSQLWRS